jgi:hypothetical protein
MYSEIIYFSVLAPIINPMGYVHLHISGSKKQKAS